MTTFFDKTIRPAAGADLSKWASEPLIPNIDRHFNKATVARILIEATKSGASDIRFRTDARPFGEFAGLSRCLSPYPLGDSDMKGLVDILGGESAFGLIQRGEKVDRAYALFDISAPNERPIRWRVNIAACQKPNDNAMGVKIVLRPIPRAVPTLDDLQIEPEIIEAFLSATDGFGVIGGATGSGKSTLNSALIDTEGRMMNRSVTWVSVESPIEYVYDVGQWCPASDITQIDVSAVNPHLRGGMLAGVNNAMRQHPKRILVGETVNVDEMRAVIAASLSGHFTMTTMHINDVPNLIQRMLNTFPSDERSAQMINIANILRFCVVQRFFPRVGGGLAAAREYLIFDAGFRRRLLNSDMNGWTGMVAEEISRRGTSMTDSLHRLLQNGLVTKEIYDSYSLHAAVMRRSIASD